ncbi:MAG: toll/interleukin-1 receptor domain-containing protein [Gammaproteobacteria bacterium]|nr:toll/interleukin-1 receptor domain-containing protein [Gammaproteobacteria bacterium]MBU1602177.1 toll/interleukin-1 receptor domain-containing protein [Gammaproteobacteria bacterium]MBU2434224.1 toll/interleukin-1 receptor domain-containing protein [Gammaproteobacteria bacterium]MBU2448452.1 toll/interleukin-1 receptor domain-containing protein [Gammaproteobacteria bacterium]
MPGIFISYRRDDQAGFAGRLADVLVSTFGADNVFRDIEDIHPGEDFVVAIEQQLAAVDVMLVVIGQAWLTVSRNGTRRLDEPEDFVRREIEAGLKSGKIVLPVLVGGATMPAERDLPPAIVALARRQSFILSDIGWTSDVARLVDVVKPYFPVSIHRPAQRSRLLWGLAVLAVIVLLAVGLKGNWPGQSSDGPTPVSSDLAQNLSGRWLATVKYDWGAEHAERFDLRLENGEVHGTASYLRVARTVEQGGLKGEQLNFITRSQEVMGDGPGREVIHRYRAMLKAGELHFVLESGGGLSVHPPVQFVARRVAGG